MPFSYIKSGDLFRGLRRDELRIAHWFNTPAASDASFNRNRGIALIWPAQDTIVRQDDCEIRLRRDDLALIARTNPTLSVHQTAWTAHLLDFGERCSVLRKSFGGQSAATVLDGADPLASMIKQVWQIGYDINPSDPGNDVIMARLLDLIGSLTEKLRAQSVNNGLSSHRAAMIERAELLIAAHLGDPAFSPSELATKMRISARHLSSLFAETGTTTSKAILKHRLTRARSLLADPANTGLQIAAIAATSGFSDSNYLTRCFRRQWGMTPREFRNSQRDQH